MNLLTRQRTLSLMLCSTLLSTLEAVHADAVKNIVPVAFVRERAASFLRGMRYGKSGYFWADTVVGVNAHTTKAA